jgi:hypothetical protein
MPPMIGGCGRLSSWPSQNRSATGFSTADRSWKLRPLDSIRYLPELKAPILLQFAENDVHLPKAWTAAVATAASGLKQVRFCSVGGELNDQATQERIAWLKYEN